MEQDPNPKQDLDSEELLLGTSTRIRDRDKGQQYRDTQSSRTNTVSLGSRQQSANFTGFRGQGTQGNKEALIL